MINSNILVIGDVMLDEYWLGTSNRISPEAPVPVVKVDDKEFRVGGAGNVALNLLNINPKVSLISTIGKDKDGAIIKKILKSKKINFILKETSKCTKSVFISFKHENIYNILKIKRNTNTGLSFSPPTSIKKIIKESNNKSIKCLILDKSYLKSKRIQNLKIKKYYYTIKTKSEFKKYNKNNSLIFENL